MAQVLIVDDDKYTADMLTIALNTMGHEAGALHTGAEALVFLAHHTPDVILLDYMMPELDGLELLKKIRCLPAGAEILVIIITAFPKDSLIHKVAALDNVVFYDKALSIKGLKRALADIGLPAVAA